ncbi:TPA: hypothetical protein ACGO8L_001922, partial [Streptococcus suis]
MGFKQQKLSMRTIFGLKGWRLELPLGSFLFIEKSSSTFFILKGWKFRGTVIFIRRLEIGTADR